MKMKSIKKMSIKYKLIIITLLVTFFVLLVCGIFSSLYFFNVLKKQVLQDEKQKLNQSAVQIANIQDEMMKIAKMIAAEPEIQKRITLENQADVFALLSNKVEIANTLSKYLNIRSDSYSVFIITDRTVYFSKGLETEEKVEKEPWYQMMETNGFTGVHEIYRTQTKSKTKVVSYVMSFYDMTSGTRRLGNIVINVNYDEIIKNLQINKSMLKGYWLANHRGDIIWSHEENTNTIQKPAPNPQNLIVQENILLDDWSLSAEISNTQILYQLRYIFIFFTLLFLAALLVLVAILWRMMTKVISPISILVKGAKEVGEGNLDCQVVIESGDEFEELGDSFNTMVGDIKNHISACVEYEKTAKEMELNRLMLQINPHFIYNTLNSIVYMAQIKGNQDIVIFSKAFISLLHDTLNVEKDDLFISLKQEMINVNNYLVLQGYRYANKFKVIYHIDENTLTCKVPNVLIQPLVENAVFHGICTKPTNGVITITSSFNKKGNVIITVEDDGVGMPQEKAEELLNESLRIKGGMRKIGIANIKERIQYIYGNDFGIHIESQVDMGTRITIEIPYEPKENKEIEEGN